MLVAHVGDIKLRELLSSAELEGLYASLEGFVNKWFKVKSITKDKLDNSFFDFLVSNDLYGIDPEHTRNDNKSDITRKQQFELLAKAKTINERRRLLAEYFHPNDNYIYKNHLGVKGLMQLYEGLGLANKGGDYQKILIIGELPEELQSYRHLLACLLNEEQDSIQHLSDGCRPAVRCLTGDIGLSICLLPQGITYGPPGTRCQEKLVVRCEFCNQNNEYVSNEEEAHCLSNYHAVDQIQELCLKAQSARITWLCKNLHASLPIYARQEFFIDPYSNR